MLTAGEIALGEAMIAASVTLWAIMMALYVFVFNYFVGKSEKERVQRGKRYYLFFAQVMIASGQMVWNVAWASIALGFDSEFAITASFAGFIVSLATVTILIIKEIWTTTEFVLPYAAFNIFAEILTKAYLKAIRKTAKKLTNKESADEYVRNAIEQAFASAGQKLAKDSGSASEKTEK